MQDEQSGFCVSTRSNTRPTAFPPRPWPTRWHALCHAHVVALGIVGPQAGDRHRAIRHAIDGQHSTMHHLARQGGGVMGEALRLGAALLAVLAGGGLALALVWNVANRRHLLRLQRALREREQKQERL